MTRLSEISERLKADCGKGASCPNHGDLALLLDALREAEERLFQAKSILSYAACVKPIDNTTEWALGLFERIERYKPYHEQFKSPATPRHEV